MEPAGVLETLARADLDALLRQITRHYRSGALEELVEADPAWSAALDDAEREVGSLYEAMRDADGVLARWRQALSELSRLWARVGGAEAVRREQQELVA